MLNNQPNIIDNLYKHSLFGFFTLKAKILRVEGNMLYINGIKNDVNKL